MYKDNLIVIKMILQKYKMQVISYLFRKVGFHLKNNKFL